MPERVNIDTSRLLDYLKSAHCVILKKTKNKKQNPNTFCASSAQINTKAQAEASITDVKKKKNKSKLQAVKNLHSTMDTRNL